MYYYFLNGQYFSSFIHILFLLRMLLQVAHILRSQFPLSSSRIPAATMDPYPPNTHNPNICPPIKDIIYSCTHCGQPFSTYNKMSNHRGMCRKLTNPNVCNLNSLSNPHSTISWGTPQAPTESMPESSSNQWHNTAEDPTLSLSRTARERSEPQDEALGYDNTILLSSKSLTETGRIAIDLDSRSKHHIHQVPEVNMACTLDHETEDATSLNGSTTSSPILFRDIYPPNDDIGDDVSSGEDSDDSNFFLDEADDHVEEDYEDPIIFDAECGDDDSWGSYKTCMSPKNHHHSIRHQEELDPHHLPQNDPQLRPKRN